MDTSMYNLCMCKNIPDTWQQSTSLVLCQHKRQHSPLNSEQADPNSTAIASLSRQQTLNLILVACAAQGHHTLFNWFRSHCLLPVCPPDAQAATEGLRVREDGCPNVLCDLGLGTTPPQVSVIYSCTRDGRSAATSALN